MQPPYESAINTVMWKSTVFILAAASFLAGCESQTGAPDRHDEISREIELLKAQAMSAPKTGQNIKIVVNFLSTERKDQAAVSALLQYATPARAAARRADLFASSGLRVSFAGQNFNARIDALQRSLKSSEKTEIFVLLADGATGYINVGEEITVPRFYYFGRWYTAVAYQFRQAGRALTVTARKLPAGLIEIRLTPVFSNFLPDGSSLELTELTTTVLASPGQTIIIGGADTNTQNIASALLSYNKNSQQKQTLITMTPHIQ